MSLNKSTILECLLMIKIDNSIQISEENLDEKVKHIALICQDLTDEQFKKTTLKIVSSGLELYNKIPKASVFIEYAGEKILTPEQQALVEVDKMMWILNDFNADKILTDNETTNLVLEIVGIGKLQNELYNPWSNKDYKRTENSVRRDLKEKWLTYHANRDVRYKPITVHKLPPGHVEYKCLNPEKAPKKQQVVTFYGDQAKCKTFLEMEKRMIAAPKQDRAEKVIKKLTTSFAIGSKATKT